MKSIRHCYVPSRLHICKYMLVFIALLRGYIAFCYDIPFYFFVYTSSAIVDFPYTLHILWLALGIFGMIEYLRRGQEYLIFFFT